MGEGLTRDDLERYEERKNKSTSRKEMKRGRSLFLSVASFSRRLFSLSRTLFKNLLHEKNRLMFFEQAREHAEREYSRNKRDTQVRF